MNKNLHLSVQHHNGCQMYGTALCDRFHPTDMANVHLLGEILAPPEVGRVVS